MDGEACDSMLASDPVLAAEAFVSTTKLLRLANSDAFSTFKGIDAIE